MYNVGMGFTTAATILTTAASVAGKAMEASAERKQAREYNAAAEERRRLAENQADAIEAALENLKRDSRYLFEGDVPPPYARGTGAYNGPQEKHPTTLAGALREKFERK